MRSYVKDGNLPPADAVRVEEYCQLLRPGYPTPPDVAFGIYADGAPSPFDDDGMHLSAALRRAGLPGPGWERKPASLTFVIDVSGSMDDGKPPGDGQAIAASCWSSR